MLNVQNCNIINPKDYYETYNMMSKEECYEYRTIYKELHDVWDYINFRSPMQVYSINSIESYNEFIKPLCPMLLKVSLDYGINLKNSFTEKFETEFIKILGKEAFLNFKDEFRN